jgi:hypothetical protein
MRSTSLAFMAKPARNGYVTAVAVGLRQRLYAGVRMFTWFYLSTINIKFVIKGSISILSHWYI